MKIIAEITTTKQNELEKKQNMSMPVLASQFRFKKLGACERSKTLKDDKRIKCQLASLSVRFRGHHDDTVQATQLHMRL